jgi:BTB/POZ domain
MFFSDFSSKNEIEIPDVDADAFEVMINSISGRKVILNANNVAEVYYVAEKYDLPCLRRVCKCFVINLIDSTNALIILNKFYHYNEPDINEKCVAIILDDPLTFFKKYEFLNATADVLRSIFQPIYINCTTTDIKKAFSKWLKKNFKENGAYDNDDGLFQHMEQKLKISREGLELKMARPH